MALLVRRIEEVYSSDLSLMKSGGQISWSVTSIFDTSLTACRTGKHFMNGELVYPFKGPTIPFISMVEYHLVSLKDQSRLHHTNSGRKFYPGIFFGYALYAGRICSLDEKWWADSVECCCDQRYVQEILSDWETVNERRFQNQSLGQ